MKNLNFKNLFKNNLCIFRRKPILSIILSILLLFFSIFFIKWIVYRLSFPSEIVNYEESFSQGIDNWTALDATWKAKDGEENGIIQLSKRKYATPYIQKNLKISQAPPQNFVCQIRLKVSSFTGNAVTLGTLVFPTGQITLVMNENNQIGVSYNIFEKPVYSQGLFSRLSKNQWYDIYVLVNGSNKQIIVYVGGNQVLTNPYISLTTPVQEIWLGAIWLEGGGRYGAPLNISYKTVKLGNKGLLPKLSFIKYTFNMIKTVFGVL
ncbi:hypothetical protein LGK95_08965 [Clostridium algoriphilum]|uniref:hypothetical protein n=1 Tax=Clostridium algoriphilum TaxID=198347 RepID=UPI001CF1E02A|nr:hypothetical protein [Clostridium algoriphilum]MCB2293653.1 hypothetical protein [Clostridium algoriphilum]